MQISKSTYDFLSKLDQEFKGAPLSEEVQARTGAYGNAKLAASFKENGAEGLRIASIPFITAAAGIAGLPAVFDVGSDADSPWSILKEEPFTAATVAKAAGTYATNFAINVLAAIAIIVPTFGFAAADFTHAAGYVAMGAANLVFPDA